MMQQELIIADISKYGQNSSKVKEIEKTISNIRLIAHEEEEDEDEAPVKGKSKPDKPSVNDDEFVVEHYQDKDKRKDRSKGGTVSDLDLDDSDGQGSADSDSDNDNGATQQESFKVEHLDKSQDDDDVLSAAQLDDLQSAIGDLGMPL